MTQSNFNVPEGLTKGEEDKFIPRAYLQNLLESGMSGILEIMPKMCQLCVAKLGEDLANENPINNIACINPSTKAEYNKLGIYRKYNDSPVGRPLSEICPAFLQLVKEV